MGWQVVVCESAELSSQLLRDICQRQGVKPEQLTVHSDHGAPMRGQTMLTTLQELGVAHTRSRPAVSNDNPDAESLFKTLKYRPEVAETRTQSSLIYTLTATTTLTTSASGSRDRCSCAANGLRLRTEPQDRSVIDDAGGFNRRALRRGGCGSFGRSCRLAAQPADHHLGR